MRRIVFLYLPQKGNRKGGIALFLVCALLNPFLSCSKLISDEFPAYDPVPTLNAILVGGKPFQAQLSLAQKIDNTDINYLKEGTILISGPTVPDFELLHRYNGIYASNRIASPGESYLCEVVVDDFEPLYASDTVPKLTDVEIIWHSNQSRLNEEGFYIEGVEIEFKDDPLTEDFYEVVIFTREYDYIHNNYAFNENEPILLNEGLEPFTTETLVFSDELMEGSLVSMKLDFNNGTQIRCRDDSCVQFFNEHTLIVELRHVSRAYYYFKKSYYIYEKTRYPMFVEGVTTATSVYSNVVNGHGIFASYTASVDSLLVEEEQIPL